MLPLLLALILSGDAPSEGLLSRMSMDAVLSCAEEVERCQSPDWELARELARRGEVATLLELLPRASAPRRRVIVFALYLSAPQPEVMKLMRRLSSDADEEIAYYALNYQVKLCELQALAKLTAAPYRVRAACEQWATTVSLIGKCHYTPGGAFLLSSLDHACLNVVQAADSGLRTLYPEAPASFESLRNEKAFFRARMRQRHD